jgi:hypothetical protein
VLGSPAIGVDEPERGDECDGCRVRCEDEPGEREARRDGEAGRERNERCDREQGVGGDAEIEPFDRVGDEGGGGGDEGELTFPPEPMPARIFGSAGIQEDWTWPGSVIRRKRS